jgi:hypothetical protein
VLSVSNPTRADGKWQTVLSNTPSPVVHIPQTNRPPPTLPNSSVASREHPARGAMLTAEAPMHNSRGAISPCFLPRRVANRMSGRRGCVEWRVEEPVEDGGMVAAMPAVWLSAGA